jgi:hypothetical protein
MIVLWWLDLRAQFLAWRAIRRTKLVMRRVRRLLRSNDW